MFTTFVVEEKEHRGIWKILPFLKKDKLIESYREYKNMTMRELRYISYNNNKIDWQIVYQRAGYQAKCLVCSEKAALPESLGLKRFSDIVFYKKMAENFAFNVLMNMDNPAGINIVYFDMDVKECAFAEKLCTLTDNFTIITVSKDKYLKTEESVMDKMGASLVFSGNLSAMKKADLIIAPTPIRKILDLSNRTVVITSQRPVFDISAQCYYDYDISLPEEYKEFLIEDITETYFASALYQKGRQYSLGQIVPKIAFNENSTCTVKSLAKYLDKLAL